MKLKRMASLLISIFMLAEMLLPITAFAESQTESFVFGAPTKWDNSPYEPFPEDNVVSFVYYEGSEEDGSVTQKIGYAQNPTSIEHYTTDMYDGVYYNDIGITELYERIVVHGDVTLILKDDTTLTAHKGFTVSPGNTLRIVREYSLWQPQGAQPKLIITGEEHCAAIGGDDDGDFGNIYIYAGDIEAYGGEKSAGIGGGDEDTAESGNIWIYDGIIKAYGGERAAGIGGGNNSDSGNIYLFGGEIYAYGGEYGAGIGAGGYSHMLYWWHVSGGLGGDLEYLFLGGNVVVKEAHGGYGGAGIGGGHDGDCDAIIIKGNALVEDARGGEAGSKDENRPGTGAGIGGGGHSSLNLFEMYSGEVHAYGDYGAAAIGSGAGEHKRGFGAFRMYGGKIYTENSKDNTAAAIGYGRYNDYGVAGSIEIYDGYLNIKGNKNQSAFGDNIANINIYGGTIDSERSFGGGAARVSIYGGKCNLLLTDEDEDANDFQGVSVNIYGGTLTDYRSVIEQDYGDSCTVYGGSWTTESPSLKAKTPVGSSTVTSIRNVSSVGDGEKPLYLFDTQGGLVWYNLTDVEPTVVDVDELSSAS